MDSDLAAVTCATFFALGSIAFASASRLVGSFVVNQVRILLAAVLLIALHLGLRAEVWPSAPSREQTVLLVSSGLVGLSLGDLFYFHALGKLGPRLGTLLMSTAPLWAVVGEGFARGRWPGSREGLWMAVTIAGVVLVLLGRAPAPVVPVAPVASGAGVGAAGVGAAGVGAAGVGAVAVGAVAVAGERVSPWAIVCGLLGAVGQGIGTVLAKMARDLATDSRPDSLSFTLVRMLAGLGGIVVLAAAGRGLRPAGSRRRPMTRRAFGLILAGAVFGPTLGVWLSMIALESNSAGRASVLIALTPVLMLPLACLVHHERPPARAWFGTLLAFAGTAMLVART